MSPEPYRTYGVSAKGRQPLVEFMSEALTMAGCSLIRVSAPDTAPFRLTFEAPSGERIGIVAYAFTATDTPTKNRPADEHRFQVKYGTKDGKLHRLWQDPFGLYITLLLGINPDKGFFVGADPVLNNPTLFFISKEFKQRHVDELLKQRWYAWEREQRGDRKPEPIEVFVGGTSENFLRYVYFEREALREEQGHRQLIAEQFATFDPKVVSPSGLVRPGPILSLASLHFLEKEFELTREEILDLIAKAPRLKMAVRGWVAQKHLVETLSELPGVRECQQLEEEGSPDVRVQYRGKPILIECKNVLRKPTKSGLPRLDFQRTRASKANPCSRYYQPNDFEVVAACLHARSERWEFRFHQTKTLAPHQKCEGRLDHRVVIGADWKRDVVPILRAIASAA